VWSRGSTRTIRGYYDIIEPDWRDELLAGHAASCCVSSRRSSASSEHANARFQPYGDGLLADEPQVFAVFALRQRSMIRPNAASSMKAMR
jgi:hypothetical protein